jgi:hypothetical protein
MLVEELKFQQQVVRERARSATNEDRHEEQPARTF